MMTSKSSSSNTVAFSYKQLVRESILGYVIWSLLNHLAPMIWFYPLNELEITGYESVAVVLFSPILLGIGFLRSVLQSKLGIVVLGLLQLVGLASFQAPTTLQRLMLLAVGCFSAMLALGCSLWHSSKVSRTLTAWGLVLGNLAFIVSRVWFTTFVPTWWNSTTNTVIITISLLAFIDKLFSTDSSPTDKVTDRPVVATPRWALVGWAFGSQLFATQWIVGEVSLVARWTVRGYPNTGPSPYVMGVVMLMCTCFGLLLCTWRRLATHFLWLAMGCASLCVLYFADTWVAAAGGAVCGIFLMSQWLVLMDQLAQCPVARTLCLAMLVWLVEVLFHVWTVAFNFVPGGVYTREHTDWLIYFIIASFVLFYSLGLYNSPNGGLLLSNTKDVKCLFNRQHTLLGLLFLVGLAGFVFRLPAQQFSHPPKVHPKADITAGIWAYHFGYDNRGWPSMEPAAKLINETGVDFIALLESDASKTFLGNNDLGMWLGERLGMYVDFGVSTRDHTWGTLILSKYPIVKSTHHSLPSPHGEVAPGITATVNFTGHLVDFVVAHMGNDRDVLDRELQAKTLARELKNAENPVIFLGYVTSQPFSRDYKQLTGEGNVKDIDDTDRDRWCEYIMYRGLIKLGYARVSHGGLSDTEVQMARFRIPEEGQSYKDNTRLTTNVAEVDDGVKFNSRFGGHSLGHNWVESEHRYHMGTPKYFLP